MDPNYMPSPPGPGWDGGQGQQRQDPSEEGGQQDQGQHQPQYDQHQPQEIEHQNQPRLEAQHWFQSQPPPPLQPQSDHPQPQNGRNGLQHQPQSQYQPHPLGPDWRLLALQKIALRSAGAFAPYDTDSAPRYQLPRLYRPADAADSATVVPSPPAFRYPAGQEAAAYPLHFVLKPTTTPSDPALAPHAPHNPPPPAHSQDVGHTALPAWQPVEAVNHEYDLTPGGNPGDPGVEDDDYADGNGDGDDDGGNYDAGAGNFYDGNDDPGYAPDRDIHQPSLALPSAVVREDCLPNIVISGCTGARFTDFPTVWYFLPKLPQFLICSHCYVTHIQPTVMRASFVRALASVGICRFHPHRVSSVLWPVAIESGSFRPLLEYMISRVKVRECAGSWGSVGIEGVEGGKWYLTAPAVDRSEHLDGPSACEACFADLIAGTAFESRFRLAAVAQPAGAVWACRVHIPFIKRALAKFSTDAANWAQFIALARYRLSLPACDDGDGDGGPAGNAVQRQWYRSRRPIDAVVCCGACVLDKVGLTIFEAEFEPAPDPPPSALLHLVPDGAAAETRRRTCHLAMPPLAAALDAALARGDYDLFRGAAVGVLADPCDGRPARMGQTRHTLRGGCPGFSICAACHGGIIRPLGLERFFEMDAPGEAAPASSLICSFHRDAADSATLRRRLDEAVIMGIWARFSNHVRMSAPQPACPRSSEIRNGVWYGYDGLAICPACYVSFACTTPLAGSIPLQGVRLPRPAFCSLYSPRMRRIWQAACAGQITVQELLATARNRVAVWNQTRRQVIEIRRMYPAQFRWALRSGHFGVDIRSLDPDWAVMDLRLHEKTMQALDPGAEWEKAAVSAQLEVRWASVE